MRFICMIKAIWTKISICYDQREKTGIKHCNNRNDIIEYLNDIKDTLPSIQHCNRKRKRSQNIDCIW